MELRQLRYFVRIIETGSMGSVAVHKKRERDPKKMRHHVVSHLT